MEATADTANLLKANWQCIVDQVAEACNSASRPLEEVLVVGVSKYVGPELTHQLAEAGCRHLGENRPQVLWEKQAWLDEHSESAEVHWHMIGHFQRNKVRRTLPMLHCLHSVDSLRLVETLAIELDKLQRALPVLVEVNVTEDQSKTGTQAEALPELIDGIAACPALELRGLMAMSTQHATTDQVRAEFAKVRELRNRLQSDYSDLDFSQLSMGMSGDFREAILEGATMVRIGTSLWQGILQ